jgi:hypothetical protein
MLVRIVSMHVYKHGFRAFGGVEESPAKAETHQLWGLVHWVHKRGISQLPNIVTNPHFACWVSGGHVQTIIYVVVGYIPTLIKWCG